jgi:tetratricopeptide (TPR) repeat protein
MPEKLITQVPFSTRELYDKGVAAVQKRNLDYAVTLFMQVLRLEPGLYEAREALRATQHQRATGKTSFFKKFVGSASAITRGQIALRSSPQEALLIAEEVLNDDPGNVAAHELLAEAAIAAGFPKTAILSLEVAFKTKPTERKLAINLADAHAQLGNRARAERLLRDLLNADPTDPALNEKLKNVLANRTIQEQGYDQAETGEGSYRNLIKDKAEAVALEQANRTVKDADVADNLIATHEAQLAKEPGNLRLMRDIADLCRQKGDFDRAAEFYQRVIDVGAINDPMILQLLRDTRLAKFDQRLQAVPADAPDRAAQQAAIRAERAAWQLDDAKQRAEANPTDLGIRYELGELYFHAGKLGEAIAELQKGQNNPNRRIAAMNLLAQCFAKRNMNDLAVRKFREALKEKLVFDDEAKELRYQLGCVLEKMGKADEAIEQFKLIYEQDVSYRDVMAKVDAYYAAQG